MARRAANTRKTVSDSKQKDRNLWKDNRHGEKVISGVAYWGSLSPPEGSERVLEIRT